jgi:hypothetical protein
MRPIPQTLAPLQAAKITLGIYGEDQTRNALAPIYGTGDDGAVSYVEADQFETDFKRSPVNDGR